MNKYVLGVIFLSSFLAFAKERIVEGKKYSDRLLTPGYGIVTDDDLAYDAGRRGFKPYDPHGSPGGLYWQCYPIKIVKPKYRYWDDNDEMDKKGKPDKLCDLEIHVKNGSDLQVYGSRRALGASYCDDFKKNWARVTKKQKIICMDGETGFATQDEELGKYRLWTWDKIKSKKGCFSYFGECNTRGFAKKMLNDPRI